MQKMIEDQNYQCTHCGGPLYSDEFAVYVDDDEGEHVCHIRCGDFNPNMKRQDGEVSSHNMP